MYYTYGENIYYENSEHTSSIEKISIPAKDGYVFEGYYTELNGNGTQVIDKT